MQSVLHAAAMIPASIPSPDWSGFDIPLPWGSLRIHAYALCILAGIIAGLWLTSVRWATARRARGQRLGHRHLGHPVRHHRRPALPRVLLAGRVLRSGLRRHRRPVPDPADPARRPGHLGRRGARRRGRLDRLPAGRGQAQRLPGRRGARAAAGPGHRPVGKLLQPGALRRPHHAAVGTADRRRQPQLPGRHARRTRCSTRRSSTNRSGTSPACCILLALDRRFSFRRGRLFCLYAIYYTLGRVWIEAMRIDDAEQISLFGITTRLNVWTSIFVFAGARWSRSSSSACASARNRTPSTCRAAEPAAAAAAKAATARTPAGAEAAGATACTRDGVEATPATAPTATGNPVRHSDSAVSDSESRDNLPDNQSGPGRASAPAEAVQGHPPAAPSPPPESGSRKIRPPGHRNRAGG